MAKEYYNRYSDFFVENQYKIIPFAKIPEKKSDKFEVYKIGVTRFDKLSQKYYNNPWHGWLIQLANPQFGLEFDIPDQSIIRIPFPFNQSLSDYEGWVKDHIRYYGV